MHLVAATQGADVYEAFGKRRDYGMQNLLEDLGMTLETRLLIVDGPMVFTPIECDRCCTDLATFTLAEARCLI